VRRHAVLAQLVHLAGADLDLDALPFRPGHGGVQRAVAVGFGLGDVVVELAGDGRPASMHDAQCGVALGQLLDDHPHRGHVVDLLEAEVLALHLLVDAVDVLGSAADGAFDARIGKLGAQHLHHVGDVLATDRALFLEQLAEPSVGLGLELAKGEVFELPLELPDAETVGQRREDVHRLPCERAACLVVDAAQLAHPFDPVRERDEDDANVRGHSEKQLAESLGRLLVELVPADLVQTAHAGHQRGHLGAPLGRQGVRIGRARIA